MATNKQAVSARVNPVLYKKFKFVAEKNSRTISMQIEYLMRKDVEQYESENGKITEGNSKAKVIQNNKHGDNNYTENNYSEDDKE